MRVLLDECVDWRLARDLPEFQVTTVREAGWLGIENGALLKLAAHKFDVLLTVDSDLPHQQNLALLGLGVVVIRAAGTRLRDLREVLPAIKKALRVVKSGQIHVVEANE